MISGQDQSDLQSDPAASPGEQISFDIFVQRDMGAVVAKGDDWGKLGQASKAAKQVCGVFVSTFCVAVLCAAFSSLSRARALSLIRGTTNACTISQEKPLDNWTENWLYKISENRARIWGNGPPVDRSIRNRDSGHTSSHSPLRRAGGVKELWARASTNGEGVCV